MKALNPILKTLLFCGLAVLNWHCTQSPVSDEKKIQSNTITGRVELSGNLSPEEVYVWFKTFGVSTRTDKDGLFKLTLPPPAQQTVGGLDGIFSLYFYVANYQIDSVNIVLVDGNVKSSAGGLNENGELAGPMRLSKILDIDTSINQPIFFKTAKPDTVVFTFTVRATGEPVWVTSNVRSSTNQPEFMRGFLRKTDSEEDLVIKLTIEGLSVQSPTYQIQNYPTRLERVYLVYEPGMLLPEGEYEAIPFLMIHQDVPSGLFESMGGNVKSYSADFFGISPKAKNNKFVVRGQ